jgi:hypothetical protein
VNDFQPNLQLRQSPLCGERNSFGLAPPRLAPKVRARTWGTEVRRRLRVGLWFAIAVATIALVATPQLRSQAPVKARGTTSKSPLPNSAPVKVVSVKSIRIVQEKAGPAIEILSSRPVIPAIELISDPDRLVIDLPNSLLDIDQKRINVQADQITTIRAEQFRANPPVTRVTVELQAPRAHTWDAAGNRLLVHLGKNPNSPNNSPLELPSEPTLTSSAAPSVTAVRAAGSFALAASDGGNASQINAGPDTAILRLSSGGEVRVCPGTTVAITPSQNRHNLLLSMDTGALETHFALDTSTDSVMTPDFRILLVGPGEFHYAISADSQGNTCVRALPGNTAPAIVAELIGDRTYQVRATDQLMFRAGQLDRVDMAVPLECGCPAPRDAPLRATNALPPQAQSVNALPGPSSRAADADTPLAAAAQSGTASTGESSGKSSAPEELHVQVSAPFVFRGTGPPPAATVDAKGLPTGSRKTTTPALATPLPPAANASQKTSGSETASADRPHARGFFRRIGGFFSSIFH